MTQSHGASFTAKPLGSIERAQLRAHVEERQRSIGSAVYESNEVILRKDTLFAADAHWTCESLQLVADSLYTDAALAPNDTLFEIYYTIAGWYQDAHDAQCGTTEPFPP